MKAETELAVVSSKHCFDIEFTNETKISYISIKQSVFEGLLMQKWNKE